MRARTMKPRVRVLGLLAVIATSAVGCELAVDFDRSKIDGGGLPDASIDDGSVPGADGSVRDGAKDQSAPADQTAPDANVADGNVPDGNVPDGSAPDGSARDTGLPDTSALDARVPDTSVPDTSVPDTSVPDTSVPDTSVPDTSVPDTSVPDTSVPDTSVPDTSVPDTSVPDTSVPDTSVPDTSVPDTSVPDAAQAQCTPLTNAGAPAVLVTPSASPVPPLAGGALVDGDYVAVSAIRYGDTGAQGTETITSRWQVTGAASGTATINETFEDSAQGGFQTRTFTLVTTTAIDAGLDGGVAATEVASCPAIATSFVGYEARANPDGGAGVFIDYASPANAMGMTVVRTYALP